MPYFLDSTLYGHVRYPTISRCWLPASMASVLCQTTTAGLPSPQDCPRAPRLDWLFHKYVGSCPLSYTTSPKPDPNLFEDIAVLMNHSPPRYSPHAENFSHALRLPSIALSSCMHLSGINVATDINTYNGFEAIVRRSNGLRTNRLAKFLFNVGNRFRDDRF